MNDKQKVPYLTEIARVEQKASEEGYTANFRITPEGLASDASDTVYTPEQVRIVNFYRFEGVSDPEDNAILYVIETTTGEKGTLTDAYGAYSDPDVDDFIKQVEKIQKETNDGEPAQK